MTPSSVTMPWPASPVTPRLLLRPVEPDDGPVLSRLFTDPEVRRYLGGPVSAERIAVLEKAAVNHPGVFAAVRRSDGAALGAVTVQPDSRGDGRTEVSYQFLPEHWGHGYAREAVAAAVAWALEEITTARPVVIAITQEANRRSCRLLESLGMEKADTFVEWDAQQVMYAIDRAGGRLLADDGRGNGDMPAGDSGTG
ncbi:GNAT family N-acetyltransferase [Streptomyces sp. MST-110588]|uniref:GNAT family N-acetyltransferase n=1 Tax=Streptomyces sp. MST-110588 TaxID=2833628 RepID=UPI001F5C40AA|nr:GNAT family N-acetyltransferase [Streptomyces sp. MST-110588]UNO43483.1 GNAT family N-acetyltransferase [Streptomyces sp. MST-110588]